MSKRSFGRNYVSERRNNKVKVFIAEVLVLTCLHTEAFCPKGRGGGGGGGGGGHGQHTGLWAVILSFQE